MQATNSSSTGEEFVGKDLRHAADCHPAFFTFRIVQSRISQNVAFNRLPMELNEQIAYSLSNDKDLSSFAAVCRSTRNAVLSDRSGVWRSRFSTAFDFPAGKSSRQMKHDYRLRRKYIGRPCPFGEIRRTDENQFLTIIRDMIIESFSDTNLRSKNQMLLCIMFKDSGILRNVMHRTCGEPFAEEKGGVIPLLCTIQLVFTSWAFKIQICDRKETPSFVYTYPDAQRAAFGHPIYDSLITSSGIVNVQRALDISNYFKYHCTQEASNILLESFLQSPEDHLPRVWDQKLNDSSLRLGRRWRGLMGTLPPRDVLRCRRERTIIDSDEITPVTISFYKSAVNRCTWTDNLENETRALPTRLPDSKEMHTLVGVSNDTTSQIPQEPLHVKECINASADQSTLLSLPSRLLQYQSHHGQKFQQFFGAVQYSFDETFVQTSIVHRLSPIHGIPGWKRITIVPLSIKARQGSIAEGVDLRSLANEDIIQIMQGVVLPGGKIILGRWWQHESDLKDAARSGPFILWNVPGRRGVRRARQEAKNMKKGQEEIVCYGNSKDALGDVLEGSFPFWL